MTSGKAVLTLDALFASSGKASVSPVGIDNKLSAAQTTDFDCSARIVTIHRLTCANEINGT
jgi:hypothetical protein